LSVVSKHYLPIVFGNYMCASVDKQIMITDSGSDVRTASITRNVSMYNFNKTEQWKDAGLNLP